MTGLKLKMVTGLASAAALVAFAAAPANAATVGAVVFQGTTSSLTPVAGVGGSGTYAFSTSTPAAGLVPGWCVGFQITEPPIPPAIAIGGGIGGSGCSVSASGSYNNLVCGTGTTGSTAQAGLAEGDSATISVNTVGSSSVTINYGIVFVAGVGIIHSLSGPAAGVVQIAPTGGNCVTGVTAFTATGAAVLA